MKIFKSYFFIIFLLSIIFMGSLYAIYIYSNNYLIVHLEYKTGQLNEFNSNSDYRVSTDYRLYSNKKVVYSENYKLSGVKNKQSYTMTDTAYDKLLLILEKADDLDKQPYYDDYNGSSITTYYYDKDGNLIGRYGKIGEYLSKSRYLE